MRKPSARLNSMKGGRYVFSIVVLLLVCGLVFPAEPQARGFFRGLVTGLRKVTTFVIQTPAKIAKGVTRPLGPLLGPIASEILLAQLPSNVIRIVNKAERVRTVVKDVEDQQAKIDAGKKVIRERRQQLAEARGKLDDLKSSFSQALVSRSITFQQYKERVADLERFKGAMEDVEAKLVQAEKNLRPENLARLLARDALRRVPGQIEGVVFRQIDAEVSKLINPEIIERLISKRPLKPEEVIDMVLDGDIKRVLRDKSRAGDKAFMDRLKADLKADLKNDADLLKGDWRERLEKKINEIVDQTPGRETGGEGEAGAAPGNSGAADTQSNTDSGEDTAGAKRIGEYFGDAICLMSDPAFWDGFADKLFGGKGGAKKNEVDQKRLFEYHGYQSEAEAKAELAKHWGSDAFKNTVRERIRESCPAAFEKEKLKLDDILNRKLPP
jgi:hypothetical protein